MAEYLISRGQWADDLTLEQRATERRARRRAQRAGYRFERARQRMTHANNLGGWMLVENARNWLVSGANYDIPLDEMEEELRSEIDRALGRGAA